MSKAKSLWNVCENISFLANDFEKVEYLAVSAIDLTSIPPSEQGTIGRGELLLRNREVNIVASILIDEIAEMKKTLSEILEEAERVYKETHKANKAS